MRKARYVAAVLAACFVGVLVYTTMASAPRAPSEQSGARAERACEQAVRDSVAAARFPIAANAADLGGGRYRLDGVVDAGASDQTVRQNYECLIRRDAAGAYVADSVRVWQSH
ncbi:MAG: hypothetical protein KY464_01915 [Gemmatimonadetes bacterium]|nr:hypothetical protein [Gemmatimonadota bacterium]